MVGYEALAGRRPFPQEDLGALARAILHDSPPPVAALRPDVPPGLAATIERAMARDPARRFGQANAMRATLARTGRAPVPLRLRTLVMESPLLGGREELARPRRKLWAAAILSLLILAIMLLALDPVSAPSPTPATTSTPVPPSTTTVTATPNSATPQPPPPPGRPGPPGKGKHKGGEGD